LRQQHHVDLQALHSKLDNLERENLLRPIHSREQTPIVEMYHSSTSESNPLRTIRDQQPTPRSRSQPSRRPSKYQSEFMVLLVTCLYMI